MNSAAMDLLKIIVQLAGAIIVARLTVTWALGRHKNEKTWERKEAAFSDILNALMTMERAAEHQYRLSSMFIEFTSADKIKSLQDEFSGARQQYQRAISTAQLLLPDQVAASMLLAEERLFEMSSSSKKDVVDERTRLHAQVNFLRRHRSEIVQLGRSVLGDPNKTAPDILSDPVNWFRYKNEIRKSFADKP